MPTTLPLLQEPASGFAIVGADDRHELSERDAHLASTLTWFSTTHFRPCSHSRRGGPTVLICAAAPLPGVADGAPEAGPAGTAPLRSPRFFAFMSSAAHQA